MLPTFLFKSKYKVDPFVQMSRNVLWFQSLKCKLQVERNKSTELQAIVCFKSSHGDLERNKGRQAKFSVWVLSFWRYNGAALVGKWNLKKKEKMNLIKRRGYRTHRSMKHDKLCRRWRPFRKLNIVYDYSVVINAKRKLKRIYLKSDFCIPPFQLMNFDANK